MDTSVIPAELVPLIYFRRKQVFSRTDSEETANTPRARVRERGTGRGSERALGGGDSGARTGHDQGQRGRSSGSSRLSMAPPHARTASIHDPRPPTRSMTHDPQLVIMTRPLTHDPQPVTHDTTPDPRPVILDP